MSCLLLELAGLLINFGISVFVELEHLIEITELRIVALEKHITRVVVAETRLTLGVGSGFTLNPASLPKLQSLTRNRFRFAEGKILVDLPPRKPAEQIPMLAALLEAL